MPYKQFDVSGIGTVKIYKRKRNRSLRLTVAADGGVSVTMPAWTPYQAGVAFTLSKRDWIIAHTNPSPQVLTTGLRIGKSHHLKFEQLNSNVGVKTGIHQTEIIITYGTSYQASDQAVQSAAQSACWRALRKQAVSLLPQRLLQLASAHDMTYGDVTIKRMKTRWGSCDQNNNIVLNLYLVQLPWEFIDYVLLHELAHTKVLHHGPDFWSEMESILPGARRLRRAIKQYRPALMVAE